jgi:uncharacterized protein YpmB
MTEPNSTSTTPGIWVLPAILIVALLVAFLYFTNLPATPKTDYEELKELSQKTGLTTSEQARLHHYRVINGE